VFLAFKIALQVFVAIIRGKAILQVVIVRESKGILLALAEFVRRLRIRISCFLLMFAAKPTFRFSGSVNKGL
jgi:hypothetical protein